MMHLTKRSTHAHTRARAHLHAPTRTHTHTHTHTHSHTHTHMRARAHTHTVTHVHTHTRTNTHKHARRNRCTSSHRSQREICFSAKTDSSQNQKQQRRRFQANDLFKDQHALMIIHNRHQSALRPMNIHRTISKSEHRCPRATEEPCRVSSESGAFRTASSESGAFRTVFLITHPSAPTSVDNTR